MNFSHRLILFSVLLASFGCQPNKIELTSLITIDQLNELPPDSLIILDCRDRQSFENRHIPGALNLDWEDLVNPDKEIYGFIATPRQANLVINPLGIGKKDHFVLYDDAGGVEAARVWWVMKNFGFKSIALLEGGIIPWKESGFDLESGRMKQREPGKLKLNKVLFHKAEKNQIERVLRSSAHVILDVRTREEYTGEVIKDGAKTGGRIPGSVHLDYMENFELSDDGQPIGFKPREELEIMYSKAGITKDKTIIPYCHTGVRSSLTTFVLVELLEYKRVLNYDGSWREWSHQDESLITKGGNE